MQASVQVFTFKEGVLARVAHDLRLSVHELEAVLEGGRVVATCRAESLYVDGVMRDGQLHEHELSDSDKRRIHDTITDEILAASAHPEIRFEASVRALDPTRLRLDGQLVLRGVQRPCGSELRLTSNPGTWVASFELVPSTFGIRPYRALAGAIRVADRVQVRVELTLGDAEPSALLAAQTPTRFTGSLAGPRVR